MESEVGTRIAALLTRELRVSAATIAALTPETPLLGRGIGFDSMEALTLATAVENEFHIRIEDQELTPDLFRTFGSFTGFVEARIARERDHL